MLDQRAGYRTQRIRHTNPRWLRGATTQHYEWYLEHQVFAVQINKVRAYSPTNTVYVKGELEEAYGETVTSSQLLSTKRGTLVFPPKEISVRVLQWPYDPRKDCLFPGSFYDIKAKIREYDGYKIFHMIASSYLEEYFATTDHLVRAKIRFRIVASFNAETNGGWFYHLSNRNRRLLRLSCNDLLKTPSHGGNPYLTKALRYMRSANMKNNWK